MQTIAAVSSNFYTLSYSPKDRNFDGSFRELSVEVKVPHVRLDYRNGYFARENHDGSEPPSQDEQNSLDSSEFATDNSLGAPAPSSVLFKSKITTEAGLLRLSASAKLPIGNVVDQSYQNTRFRLYDVLFWIDPTTLELTNSGDGNYSGKIEMLTVTYDNRGDAVSQMITKADLHLDAQQYSGMMKAGVTTKQTIAVPARGNFFFRISVHDLESDNIGALEVPVSEVKPQPLDSSDRTIPPR